jgi:peptidoglycan hydrolase-like protein with peptidoglycan-binding domain
LQEGLAILGYNLAKIDGVLGPQTLAAMEKYKKDKGLSSTVSVEAICQLVSMDAALKLLDKIQDLYEESAAPKPTLRK